ncbi:MAG: 5'-3' exonuclease H3TH domain-containing protein [Schlesneria sp.]
MSHLLCDLVFIDSDADGRECHRTFPAGSPVTEAREGDLKWADEIKIIDSRIRENARKGDRDFYCMYLGSRPRLLHRRYWDPSFQQDQDIRQNHRSKTVIATAESESEGWNPSTIPEDETAQLGGRDDSDHQLKRLIPASAPVPDRDLVNYGQDGIPTTLESPSPGSGLSQQGCRVLQSAMHDAEELEPSGPDVVERRLVETETPQGCQPPEALGSAQAYGMVVVVDLLNLLVRAFHAGAPSKINGVKSLLLTCANIIEKLSPEYLIFAADGGHAERSAACPDYKAHRPPKPPELVAQIELAVKVISAIGWPIVRVKGWEADDVIASLAATVAPVSAGFVVCSCDKDLLQLLVKNETDATNGTSATNGTGEVSAPFGSSHTSHQSHSSNVKIYHPWDGGKFFGQKHITEKYAIKPQQFADYLALVGDASDGIPGVKGIGPKKAAELLATYPDLGSILEAARCVFIKGSAGRTLNELADVARMSRRLVELHRGLQIPTDWHDTPATSPTAGWIDALRSNDLGAVVNRLCDVLPISGRVRSRSSLIEVTNEQPSLFPAVDRATTTTNPVAGDRQVSSDSFAGDSTPERRDGMPDRISGDPKHADGIRTGDGLPDPLDEQIPESSLGIHTSAVCPSGFVSPDSIDTFPLLSQLPAGASDDVKYQSIYAASYRDSRAGRFDRVNPWKIGSHFAYAWNLGFNMEAFKLPPREQDMQAVLVPMKTETPSKSPQKALF